MSLQPIFITGTSHGLMKNKKPFLLPNDAFQTLENAYVFRERVVKRQGLQFLGRLRRVLEMQSLGNTTPAASTMNFSDIFTTLGITGEPDAEIEPGTLVITIAAPDDSTFTDQGDGTFSVTGLGVAAGSYINYATGEVNLEFSAPLTGGAAITASINYFPGLPVMGIVQRELSAINDEQTIWFDTKYAYIWNGTDFQEFIAGTTWGGTNSDFFWATNYRGIVASTRLLFVTNFVNDAADPMRYTDGNTWTTFAPAVSATEFLFQSRILISYYGRLLALNTWEGTAIGTSVNYFNRCRFSQIGSPIAADAWRSDQFGKGGFLDAPTNEQIVSAAFIKNTLIVYFEKTTWQLRYVGEYGLPFIWERVSADFGSESTFSSVLFDKGVLTVGDKAIITGDGNGVDRIDLDIPDQIFDFQNQNEGVKRIQGIRDYTRELVFWCYADSNTEASPGVPTTFPNKVLLYNYRNNTYAIFRDNVTAFGTFQLDTNILWDSLTVFWDDEDVTWDNIFQTEFPAICSGNQQGFIHLYGYTTPDEQSLTITDITTSGGLVTITSPNHNLEETETIYITGLQFIDAVTFLPVATDLNDVIYNVLSVVDANTFTISKWSTTNNQYENNFTYTPVLADVDYIGGGRIALFPKLNVQTKDLNIYQAQGNQTKLSYIDFLMDATPSSAMSIILYLNTSPAIRGNMLVGNQNVTTSLTPPFYGPASDIAWFRFYATLSAYYFNIVMTYDDTLMNLLSTHQQTWVLNAINAFVRPGGRNQF